MKFINYLESISGISIYALTSLVIFVLFFTLALAWSILADKKMIEEISQIPLDENNYPNQ
jgi:cytochrome c oxidase cbb3-type subunit 3